MNELQHLTTPTGLKFCLALCFSSGPNSSKFGPSCPQVGSQLFSFGERDGDNFFRARANPDTLPPLMTLRKKAVENIMRRENAG